MGAFLFFNLLAIIIDGLNWGILVRENLKKNKKLGEKLEFHRVHSTCLSA